jgi:hypothetical protein
VSLDWNWTDLITGVLGVIIGWVAKLLHLGGGSSTPPTFPKER